MNNFGFIVKIKVINLSLLLILCNDGEKEQDGYKESALLWMIGEFDKEFAKQIAHI